jgi:bifunctional enzyme CysN/CysC
MIINRVTLLGHKDHGKSTLIGSMLITTRSVSEERIAEAKSQSKKLGRKFEPGFILDSFSEERKGGLTIDTSRAQVKYRDSAFEFIDVPGHEELIKNMISGASYAKFALLIVSANKDEGIRPQTKRHIYLSRMLGIDKLIVAVNKMDTVGYSKDRFERIRKELSEFLEKIGVESRSVHFVPISAYGSENLSKKSPNMHWYKGKPLLELMREMAKKKAGDSSDGNMRVILQGSMPHEQDSLLIGSVASGTIKVGGKIKVLPINFNSKVAALFVKGVKKKTANVSENVAIKLVRQVTGDSKGSVVYDAAFKGAKNTRNIGALVFIVKKIKGQVRIKFNGIELSGKVGINKLIDTTTGFEIGPRSAQQLNAAIVDIKLDRDIPAEPFTSSRELGRFVIYQGDKFSGIGIINSVGKR